MSNTPAKKKKTYTLRYFLFGMGISVLMAAFSFTETYNDLEHRTYDGRFVLRGEIPQHPDIGTVDIDDETYQEEGRMEDWQRSRHADLIETLAEWQVRMLGFDIFMPEPSESFITEEEFEERTDLNYKTAEDFRALFIDHDQVITDASQKAGNVFFSGFFEILEGNPDWEYVINNTIERNALKEEGYRAILDRGFYIDFPGVKDSAIPRAIDFFPPLASHTNVARSVGYVQPLYENDGVARWFPLVLAYDGKVFPSLVLAMTCEYLRIPLKSIEIVPSKYVRLPSAQLPNGQTKDILIPIDSRGAMLVNWTGQYEETFTHYPYARLISLKESYENAVALRDVKRLVQMKPGLLQDSDKFYEEAINFNIPPMAATTAYETVKIFGMFEEAIKAAPDMEAIEFFVAQGVPKEEVPPDMVERFNEIRYNLKMVQYLEENSSITLQEIADRLGLSRLILIEHGYFELKNLIEHGGIKPEHHPLVFFSVFHDGKELLPSDLKDKMLIYGLTATGTQDYAPVPVQGRYKMVGYHANALNTILTEQFLTRLAMEYRILILLVLGAFMGLIIPKFGPGSGTGVVFALLITQVSASYYLFVYQGLWIDIVAPVGVIFLSYLTVSVNNYLIERKERAYIQGSFKMYLSPAVVDQITGNPDLLQLGGQRRELTILFTDVAGFSTISERLTPEGLVELLNEYLGAMTELIMANNGTVDKYEGDLIMAFWGAPIENENHALDACIAMLVMRAKLIAMREQWRNEGRADLICNLDARIGVDTGEVVVGNMGSKQRFDYTVMGDHVNLASRLEGANKPYKTNLMISEFTYAKVKDHVAVRELDKIRVVGRKFPVTVYELLARKDELDGWKEKVVDFYAAGLSLYKERKWTEAQEHFVQALSFDPNDGPSKVYIGRCDRYKANPPPENWDGAESLTEK
ncbi:MAG: CHASE2 domain-containing protein [candidate division Zixibacteria bacterium]|nr:CHASE2 domain-containing protein [candidate division Zixibacteria bacterium]